MFQSRLAGAIPALALVGLKGVRGMKFNSLCIGAALALVPGMVGAATVVEGFGGGSPWEQTLQAGDGSVEIVDLSSNGGNLENNAPLPTGAARFETLDSNADRAEIAVEGDFGRVSDIFKSGLNFSYSLFKEETGEDFGAPSMKLAFYNPDVTATGDDRGYTQLIFEPNWNQPGAAGSSTEVPAGDWVDYSFGFDTGVLWSSQGFGTFNSAGGSPLLTLEDWLTEFNSDFLGANLLSVSIGLGTYNKNNVGYVDNVGISGTSADATYDFEAAAPIPIPAALPLLMTALGGLGLAARRRRKTA